ncbi:MAG TPA: peptide ABC transporter substrate-binding protein [Candidatus Eremiobacteraceae bacterium]|jgi:peptide/nickel transport system substrate-binding protein
MNRVKAQARALLAFALAAILSAAAGGCYPSEATTDDTFGQSRPGVLRMAGDQQPDNLNPLIGTQTIDTDLALLWASYLFLWNDHDQFVPELATAVPSVENGGVSKNGLIVTYHLRRGVRWQDGAPFTAADVVYSWRQVMNPRNDAGSRQGYDLISKIETPDNFTLVVHLKQKYAPFVATFFSMSGTTYCIMPQHLLGKLPDVDTASYSRLPVGTGPFRVVSNDSTGIVLAANPDYWRGPPKLKEIDFRYIPRDREIINLMKTHKVDFYENAAQALEPELHGIDGATVYLYPFTRWTDIGFNLARPQLRDRHVREALAYAIDRNRLIERVTHGVNFPADSDQPPYFWAHDAHVPTYPFNPGMAKRILDRAGWRIGRNGIRARHGVTLQIQMVGAAGSQTTADTEALIRHDWHAVGARVSVRNYPSSTLYDTLAEGGIEQRGKFDVAIEEWANGVDPDESQLFMCRFAPPAGWNIYHYCNPALDAAENAGLSDYRRGQRKAHYDRVQDILATDLPIIVLWFSQRQDVVNVNLQNYRPAHAVSPFWNAWQWAL